ncbi:helix-turn-helix transcriptional regulator [uncultured Agitococcus sp.]|uniref:helix-turn-helix domain-containing protein n=1 Tax=uncultured Agitococcus sp. TaxID=1506599 RepID=UPI00260E7F4B|nr:helix-turn-helix transcriptional regulator [uncultured Agitococcus sp.]
MNYQTINAKELTQKAIEKHGSQYSVAKATGVNHALISKMISGKLTNPTLKTVNKLLECLQ